MRLLVSLGFMVCASLPLAGAPQERDYKLTADANLVVLDVSVKDASGYVSTLTKDDFQVRENGKVQKLSGFSHGDDPVTVGLVIDDSGSMRPKRVPVINAALGFIDSSNPKDEVFVTHFNDFVRSGLPEGIPFSDDPVLLRASLFRNPPAGRTALYDAIVFSLHHLNDGKQEKKSLLLVSDGGDNASVNRLSDVVQAVRESRATIYTIGIFDEDDADKNPGLLHRLASVSGGEAFLPQETADLNGICRQIAKDIRNRYTISYVPSDTDGKRLRTISVTATSPQETNRPRANFIFVSRPRSACGKGSSMIIRATFSARQIIRIALLATGIGCLGVWSFTTLYSQYNQLYLSWRFEQERADSPEDPAPLPIVIAPHKSGHASIPSTPRRPQSDVIGRVQVPRLHLTAMVEEGTDDETLGRAVGHVRGTALPGDSGNVGIAGHRDSFFRALKDLQRNDEIDFETTDGTFRYTVEQMSVVEPSDVQVLAPTDVKTLTIVTCFPFHYIGPAPRRFIVRARQVAELSKWTPKARKSAASRVGNSLPE